MQIRLPFKLDLVLGNHSKPYLNGVCGGAVAAIQSNLQESRNWQDWPLDKSGRFIPYH